MHRPTPAQVAGLRRAVDQLGSEIAKVAAALDVIGCAREARGVAGVEGAAHQVATCRPTPPSSPDFPRFLRNPEPGHFARQVATLRSFPSAVPAGATRWPSVGARLAELVRCSRLLARVLGEPAATADTPWSEPVRVELVRTGRAVAAFDHVLTRLQEAAPPTRGTARRTGQVGTG